MLKKRRTWLTRGVAFAAASLVAVASGTFGVVGAQETAQPAQPAPTLEATASPIVEAPALPTDTTTVSTPTPTEAELPLAPTSPLFSPALPSGVAGPISVTRTGNVDVVTVDDPEGEAWEWGGKASLEDVFALRYEGKGEIMKVHKVVADGRTLDPELVGFVNGENGSYVAFSLQALYQVPPQKVELHVETTAPGDYTIADAKDVPAQADLAASGYVAPNIDEMNSVMEALGFRAASQSNSVRKVQLKGWEGGNRLAEPSGGKGPKTKLRVNIGGTNGNTKLYLTELVLRHWDSSAGTRYGLEGPITVKKNGGWNSWDICTINNPQVNAKRANGTNQEISIDLSSCNPDMAVHESGSDHLEVEFYGPSSGNPQKEYEVELYANTFENTWNKPLGPAKQWSEGTQWGTQSLAVQPGAPKGVTAKVLMERTVDRATTIRGTIDARVQHQNGWDFEGSSQPKLTIYGPNGSVLHTQTLPTGNDSNVAPLEGGNGWGGVRFILPRDIQALPGTRVAVEMEFHGRGIKSEDVRDSSFDGPWGPGDLKLIMYPTDESWLHKSEPNPPLPKRCGLRIAIVGDQSESLSYGDQNGWEASRNAAKGLLKALEGTPSKVGIYSFGSHAPASGKPGVGESDGALDVNDPADRRVLNRAIDEWAQNRLPELGGSTNWEAGLKQLQGQGYDVVYFITDGMPTLNEESAGKDRLDAKGTFADAFALNSAIDAANKLKREGTRIVPLMVAQTADAGNIIKQDVLLKGVRSKNNMDKAGTIPQFGDFRYKDSSRPAKDEFVKRAFYPRTKRFFVFQPVIEGGDYVVEQYDGSKWVDVTSQSEKWTTGLRGVTQMTDDISGPGDTISIAAYSQLAGQLGSIARELAAFCKLTKTADGDVEKLSAQDLNKLGLGDKVGQGEEAYKAHYTVTYQGVGSYQSIIDTPQLPQGTRMLGAKVTWNDEFGGQVNTCSLRTPNGFRLDNCASGNGPDTMASRRVISEDPNRNGVRNRQKHEYTVEVFFARDARAFEKAYPARNPEVCEAADGDLVNIARMGENEAIACNEIPDPDPRDFGLVLRKADYDNQTALNGAEFEVHWSDATGRTFGTRLVNKNGVYRSQVKLQAGVRYSLVETKAPTWQREDGTGGTYSLLADSVDFELQWNENSGHAEIVFYNGDTPVGDLSMAGAWNERPSDADPLDAYMQVANIRQGELPKTGGVGVGVTTLLSLLIIGGGIFLARRRA